MWKRGLVELQASPGSVRIWDVRYRKLDQRSPGFSPSSDIQVFRFWEVLEACGCSKVSHRPPHEESCSLKARSASGLQVLFSKPAWKSTETSPSSGSSWFRIAGIRKSPGRPGSFLAQFVSSLHGRARSWMQTSHAEPSSEVAQQEKLNPSAIPSWSWTFVVVQNCCLHPTIPNMPPCWKVEDAGGETGPVWADW